MTVEIWQAIVVFQALSFAWVFGRSLYREHQYSRAITRISQGINSLPESVQKVENSLDNMMECVSRYASDSRSDCHDLRQLHADTRRQLTEVELRLGAIIRDAASKASGVGIFNSNSGPGSQTNQGERLNDIHRRGD